MEALCLPGELPEPCGAQAPLVARASRAAGARGPPAAAAAAAALLGLTALAWRPVAGGAAAGGAAGAVVLAKERSASHGPQYARVDGDIETLWQRPDCKPRGIFFMAHGCHHQAPDFWNEVGPDGRVFEGCAQSYLGRCLGLPEEARVRDAALARCYVAVAVSGGRGFQSCWFGADVGRVARALAHVRGAEGLAPDAPVLATGASSGGAFLGMLVQAPGGLEHARCIVPQVSPLGIFGKWRHGIPVLFVHMPRDGYTEDQVVDDKMALEQGLGGGARVAELRVKPQRVTAQLLEPCLNSTLAAAVAEALRANSSIVGRDGLLVRDARARDWVETVRAAIAGESNDSLDPDESCIAERMNVAWAWHEFTGQYAEEMLDFCEERGVFARNASRAAAAHAP